MAQIFPVQQYITPRCHPMNPHLRVVLEQAGAEVMGMQLFERLIVPMGPLRLCRTIQRSDSSFGSDALACQFPCCFELRQNLEIFTMKVRGRLAKRRLFRFVALL
jgi:hypothetical protein